MVVCVSANKLAVGCNHINGCDAHAGRAIDATVPAEAAL